MSTFVRVKLADGARVTVSEEFAEIHGLERVTDSAGNAVEALDPRGGALPAQPARSVDEAAYDAMTPAEKGAATRARKKAEAEAAAAAEEQNAAAREQAQQMADAANAAADADQPSPTGDGAASTEETR